MRATIDLDHPGIHTLTQAWELLAGHGDGDVYGRVSSSGQGVHLKVHGCTAEKAERLRIACRDDIRRIKFDEQTSMKPKQILFDCKNGKQAGKWLPDLEKVIEAYSQSAPPAYHRHMLVALYPVARPLLTNSNQ